MSAARASTMTKRRSLVQVRSRDPDHWPYLLERVLAGVVAEHGAEAGVQVGQLGVGDVRRVGEQGGEVRAQASAGGEESRADGVDLAFRVSVFPDGLGVLVPCLAPFGHLRLERLGLRVGREVVLADPVLADDQRVTRGHDLFLP